MKHALFALLFAWQSAFAFLPATGLWNNLSYDGQGFNIETQNNVMIVTAYLFDQSGNQIWYLAVGTYDENSRRFSGTLANATNGSCLACTYRTPAKNGNAGGTITINFDSPESGTIFYPGGSRQITHFNYGYAGKTGYFYGEWQFSFDISTLVDGSWIVFPGTTYQASDGNTYASGYMDGKSSTTVALGFYDTSTGLFGVAFNDGVGYTRTFALSGDSQHMIGLAWFGPDGASISGSGYPAAGNRILVASELGSYSAASPSSSEDHPEASNSRYEEMATAIQRCLNFPR